jgi:hypothetical protein
MAQCTGACCQVTQVVFLQLAWNYYAAGLVDTLAQSWFFYLSGLGS